MSKTYMNNKSAVTSFENLFAQIPFKHHIRIHRILSLTVPVSWKIEQNRKNTDLHLIFVKGGSGYYFLQGKKEILCRGKIIFVSNRFPHSAQPDKSDPPSIIPIRFGIYDNNDFNPIEYGDTPFCLSILPSDIIGFERKFEQLNKYYHTYSDFKRIQAGNSILTQILFDITQNLQSEQDDTMDKRLQHVRQFIDREPSHTVSVSTLAKKAGLSEKHFTQLFKQYYGSTPKQYQIKSVMRCADFLLENTNMSIKEISSYLSYPDQYSFTKQYKKNKGISPKKYRTHAY